MVVGEVDIHRRFVFHAGEDSGVVHQVVDTAEVVRRRVGKGLAGIGGGHIGLDEQGLATLGIDPIGHPLALLFVDFGHHHGGPLGGQPAGVGFADALAGAGHHGNAVVKTHEMSP